MLDPYMTSEGNGYYDQEKIDHQPKIGIIGWVFAVGFIAFALFVGYIIYRFVC